MTKTISRRRFLERSTAASGAVLFETTEANAVPAAPGSLSAYRPTVREMAEAYRRQERYGNLIRTPVYRIQITPHWVGDTENQFWYRNDGPQNTREFLFVDAPQGIRRPAFDHSRLARALGAATGKALRADRLPIDAIEFSAAGRTLRFSSGGQVWDCDLDSYACTKTAAAMQTVKKGEDVRRTESGDSPQTEGDSPDGRWAAFVRDHNLWLRDVNGGVEKALTTDGTAQQTYGKPTWSPDSRTLAAFRIRPTSIEPVYMVEAAPKNGSMRGKLHQHEYAQPGDPFPVHEPWLFDPNSGTGIPAAADPIDFGEEPPEILWRPDGSGVLYEQTERGHQRFRVLAVDVPGGRSRAIVDERSKTFINTSHGFTYYTKDRSELLYASEQDGWRHLYLCDAVRGGIKNPITRGEWVVREVDMVDETARQIWFRASGKNPGENPYHIHYYRVNFDGTGLVALTDGNGNHSVQYSPDRAYIIDTCSRPDLPPIHTLRRVADGSLVCPLETADIAAATSAGWRPPEVFRAKGRDGKTDIWGLVFRPLTFDPKRRYPVIENIYAGPHDSFVRQSFSLQDGMQSLAELGFIVIQCDGMGTRNRSKAFHDVCWRNIKDAGLPDRIAWIKALAARYPHVDAGRVGIYGTSAGGQSSTGALLFHPDFYKVAVSSCGCHDNRIDKRWWNEQWMGTPIGPWYADSSNITHAGKLRGKLMLLVGELDTNVPPESTIRLADALIKADKEFELVVLPGLGHTGGGAFGERKRRDFFVRHLLGVEPPDRNVPRPAVKPVVLKPIPLDQENLASGTGGAGTTIQIRNRTGGEIKLFWLPGEGQRRPYGSIPAGVDRELNTYAGHYWLITDSGGKPIAMYVGDDRPGIVEVR